MENTDLLFKLHDIFGINPETAAIVFIALTVYLTFVMIVVPISVVLIYAEVSSIKRIIKDHTQGSSQ